MSLVTQGRASNAKLRELSRERVELNDLCNSYKYGGGAFDEEKLKKALEHLRIIDSIIDSRLNRLSRNIMHLFIIYFIITVWLFLDNFMDHGISYIVILSIGVLIHFVSKKVMGAYSYTKWTGLP